jgi:hypothetical protein
MPEVTTLNGKGVFGPSIWVAGIPVTLAFPPKTQWAPGCAFAADAKIIAAAIKCNFFFMFCFFMSDITKLDEDAAECYEVKKNKFAL